MIEVRDYTVYLFPRLSELRLDQALSTQSEVAVQPHNQVGLVHHSLFQKSLQERISDLW